MTRFTVRFLNRRDDGSLGAHVPVFYSTLQINVRTRYRSQAAAEAEAARVAHLVRTEDLRWGPSAAFTGRPVAVGVFAVSGSRTLPVSTLLIDEATS